MTRIDSTKIKWRVQVRNSFKGKKYKWLNRGLFETRKAARDNARWFREGLYQLGFGNTRVVRHISGKGRSC